MSERLRMAEERIKRYDLELARRCVQDERCWRLTAVEGVGPLAATALVGAVGNAQYFRDGRELSAWLGLVPRHHKSSNREMMLGISKRGDRYLRTLTARPERQASRPRGPEAEWKL